MIEALAPYRFNQPSCVRVLPRRPWCGEDLLDAHSARGGLESSEREVPIANEVMRRGVFRKRFTELLGRPGGGFGWSRHSDNSRQLARRAKRPNPSGAAGLATLSRGALDGISGDRGRSPRVASVDEWLASHG